MMDFAEEIDSEKYENKVKAGFVGQRMIILPRKIITSLKRNSLINQLYMTDIGYFPHAKHHFRERKSGSKQYILLYCMDGQGVINVNDRKIDVQSNSFCIIPPKTKHSYYAVQSSPWSIYWLHFTGPQAEQLYVKFTQVTGAKSTSIPYNERRVNLFDNIINVLEEGYSDENIEFVNLSLWQLLSSFIYSRYFTEIGKEKVDGDIITTSINYMKEHISETLKVNDIANYLHYSNSHFFSLFKKKTGYSPIHYFNHLKIQKACQALSFTDMSVKEISFSLGYEDPLYFSRLFKKTMNISPNQYRSEYKN